MIDNYNIWLIIIVMGLGSFGLRFVFLGLVGDRPLPDWVIRHLRYTAVAILPALVAPLVVWPDATSGHLDPARMAAAIATLGVGLWSRNVLAAIAAGVVVLYAGLWLTV
ncbi:AzlD domain-containing protein [Shimia biformata]|uniref:AzlD domain-containing protein n=1 Tax=Shimia biformata TaxID=1294299 RepID=UPI001951BFF9|nr:AzlD domain-containing protein [Shimia biformata]